MNKLLSIQTALLEIKDAAKKDLEKAARTYDLSIGGNLIFAKELRHCLERSFGVSLTIEEMHQLVPLACKGLGMKCEPMKSLNDLNGQLPADYSITLYN